MNQTIKEKRKPKIEKTIYTKEEREKSLEKLYLDSKDIYYLIPKIGKEQAIKKTYQLQEDSRKAGYYIPETNGFMVPTKYARKELRL